MKTRGLVSCSLLTLLVAIGCGSENDGIGKNGEPPASEQETASRASDAVLRLASLTAGTPTASGASFEGLDEANDALDGLNDALGDGDCSAVSVSADGDATVEFSDCLFEGDLALSGSLTIGSDTTIDCTDPLNCLFEASISVSAEIVVDGITVSGGWSVTINQDGEGSLSGSLSASTDDFSVDIVLDVDLLGDGDCDSSVDYTDSNGNVIDIEAACY